MKEDFKVACVNPETNEIEFHKPIELHMSQYSGEMLHFNGKKVDVMVSPNHKMLAKEQTNGKWGEYKKIPAAQLLDKKKYWKFKTQAKYVSGNDVRSIKIGDKEVPIELYLKVLGYIISEGCVYENYKKGRYDALVITSQATSSDCYTDMRTSFNEFAGLLDKTCHNKRSVIGAGFSEHKPQEMWSCKIHGKDLTQHLKNEIGTGGNCLSKEKRIPRWVLDLKPELLEIILYSLVKGDGSETISKYGSGAIGYRYSTISKQLADDVYEIAYKLGFTPNICVSRANEKKRAEVEYIVLWSDTNYGVEPLVYSDKRPVGQIGGGAFCDKINYNGVVWCFEVPTGLFVTRRNGKIAIHGNSKFAQADNLINPITLIKVGSADFKPTPQDLEAWRETFECHDEETELLTDIGFKKFDEVMTYEKIGDGVKYVATPKPGIKIACLNPKNDQMEYHKPLNASLYDYSGEMIHFQSRNLDIKVTPNHKMWAKKAHRIGGELGWKEWTKISAKEISQGTMYRFMGIAGWKGTTIESVDVLGRRVPIKDYLKFLGYVISEGYLGQNCIDFVQKIDSDCIDDIRNSMRLFASIFDKKVSERESATKDYKKSGFKQQPANRWNGRINCKDLMNHFKAEIADDITKTTAEYKKVPRWVKELNPELLAVILEALVFGDGLNITNRKSLAYRYYTGSKQLADDIQEIAFKCGFAASLQVRKTKRANLNEYMVSWSNAADGNYPATISTKGNSVTDGVNYSGKVWCFEVPTGLFITRRNGKITIQGNSAQYDKDFKIITHEAVTIERVGASQGIYDTSGDITQLLKEVFMGLMIPEVLMSGSGDVTYANGGISLDVLRQRYMQFRNMLSAWLRKKIFAPISKLNEFYEYEDGEKKLILPEIDWNHMSLFDTADFVNVLVQLSGEQKKVSQQTLYRSLGLEYDEERRKIKKEDIGDAIRAKELASLAVMPLNELRALGDEDEIQEVTQTPLPGQDSSSALPGQQQMPAGGPGGLPPLPIGAPPLPGGAGDMGLGMPPPSPGGVPGQSMPPPGPPPPPK